MKNICGVVLLISIHALRKECDNINENLMYKDMEFLSTHSVRSATA